MEFGEVRRVLYLSNVDSLVEVESEVQKLDEDITLCGPSSSHFLQKRSKRWNCFVNVDDVLDLADGDRLTVVSKKSITVEVSKGMWMHLFG